MSRKVIQHPQARKKRLEKVKAEIKKYEQSLDKNHPEYDYKKQLFRIVQLVVEIIEDMPSEKIAP